MDQHKLLQSPKNQLFYRNIAVVMSFCALNNPAWWGFEPIKTFAILTSYVLQIFAPVCIISESMYLYMNISNLKFTTLSVIFSILPATFLVSNCVYSAQRNVYRQLMKDFIHKIHLYNFKHESDFARKQLFIIEKYTRRVVYFSSAFFTIACISWVVLPVINNHNNREAILNGSMTRQTIIYLWMPFDYEYDFTNWLCIHLINIYITLTACLVLNIFNAAFYMILIHLVGHIKNLRKMLELEFSSTSTDQEAKDNLSSLVKYHTFIIRVFYDIQDSFGFHVTANYLHNLIGDSLLLYQIMFGNGYFMKKLTLVYIVIEFSCRYMQDEGYWLNFGMMLVAYLGGLMLLSFLLEEVRIQSELLADAAYSIQWEDMADTNKKTFLLLLARLQLPLEFISAGGLRAGVRPLISILKSTFSYYVMLKATVETKQ